MAGLVRYSQNALIGTYLSKSGSGEINWRTGNMVMATQGSLMHMGEQRPACVVQSQRSATVTQIAENLNMSMTESAHADP